MPSTPGPNRRVLVVDDNAAIHADFEKVLGAPSPAGGQIAELEHRLFGPSRAPAPHEPFEVEAALQGETALEMVREALEAGQPYAMAFVDMRMPPGWDGLETVSRLWKADPSLEIVFCTAYSDYSRDEIERALGRSDRFLILKKPFDPIEVVQLAAALCEKWRLSNASTSRVDELEARIERLERTNAALERANRELERVGFVAAHHLQEPLRIAAMSADRLREATSGALEDEGAACLERVVDESSRARELLVDLQAFSRLQTARPADDAADLAAAARDAVAELASAIESSGARIGIDELPRVRGDARVWREVFRHLLDNAIGWSNEAPTIAVRCERVADHWQIDVCDDGPGIPAPHRERVFELFERLSHDARPGTGAGLALCRATVAMHGGEIAVADTGAGGTTIRIRLPIGADGGDDAKPEDADDTAPDPAAASPAR